MEANQWWQFSATTSHKHCTVACAEMNVWDKQSSATEEKVSRVWWAFLHDPNNETRSMHRIAEHLEMNGYKIEITKIVNGLIILNMCHILWYNYGGKKKFFFGKRYNSLKCGYSEKRFILSFQILQSNTVEHTQTSRNNYAHLEVATPTRSEFLQWHWLSTEKTSHGTPLCLLPNARVVP